MCQIVALDPKWLLGGICDSGYDLEGSTLSTSHTRATFTKDVRSSEVPCVTILFFTVVYDLCCIHA